MYFNPHGIEHSLSLSQMSATSALQTGASRSDTDNGSTNTRVPDGSHSHTKSGVWVCGRRVSVCVWNCSAVHQQRQVPSLRGLHGASRHLVLVSQMPHSLSPQSRQVHLQGNHILAVLTECQNPILTTCESDG